MYLRTTKRKTKSGSEVAYYQLAQNVRDPESGVCAAQVVHNFGRADELDRDELVRLCRSIARVVGVKVEDPFSERGVETLAATGDVLPMGLHHGVSREYGVTYLVETLWERLGIGPELRKAMKEDGSKINYERALLAMTLNRLLEPTSKLGVCEQWLQKVYLPDCWSLKVDQAYEAMDLFHRHAAKVEEAVFFQMASLLNLDVDLVFYDTTTCSFSIDEVDDPEEGLRLRGHAKDGTWSPQVVVALAVTRDGYPVRSWVFHGNTSDVSTVTRIREELRGWKLGRSLFVADAGMNSYENQVELARGCGRYVLAVRAASVGEVRDEVLSHPGRFKELRDDLHVKEVSVGEGERRRRYIVCYNPKEATREARHREGLVRLLEEELSSHPTADPQAQWAIELQASQRLKRYLEVKGGKLQIDRSAVKTAARYDGRWVLITNDDTLTAEDAADAYKGLLVIERCFRNLKSAQIRIAPMHHWLSRRIETHVKVCVLALLIERVAEVACKRSWARIREAMSTLQVTEFRNDTHRFFRVSEATEEASSVMKALEIRPPKVILSIEPLAQPAQIV